nr:hypothetical protein [Tanacetum cinerariifolium]
MHGYEITTHVRHSRLMDEFDKKEGESLDYVYERLTALVNIMDRNNARPIPVSINTNFFNCLQPEWRKYVTTVRYNQTGDAITYEELEQLLLAMIDEAERNLSNEENDFMLDNAYGEETLDESTASVMLMARIQPANENAETMPSYDTKAVSQVNVLSKANGQVSHVKSKTIIHTSDDDQIDSSIIFIDLHVENNGGTSKHDS